MSDELKIPDDLQVNYGYLRKWSLSPGFRAGEQREMEYIERIARLEAEKEQLHEVIKGSAKALQAATEVVLQQAQAIESLRPQLATVRQDGIGLIAAERIRQVEQEGWNSNHDDEHDLSEMADAAICYAEHAASQASDGNHNAQIISNPWPWDKKWWKPSRDPIRNLVKAGALIAAEIDRLQRFHAVAAQSGGGRTQ